MKSELSKFLLAGAINTSLSFLVYQFSLFFTSPSFSYFIAYLSGLFFVYIYYPSKVFKSQHSFSGVISVIVYLSSFLLGLLIVGVIPYERLAVLVAIAVTTAYNFFVTKLCLGRLV